MAKPRLVVVALVLGLLALAGAPMASADDGEPVRPWGDCVTVHPWSTPPWWDVDLESCPPDS